MQKNLEISKESKENLIFKEIQPKLTILNKYFKLEELKHQEKVSRFKDGFIDSTEKPNFFFMRSENKIKNNDFKPSTQSYPKRNKTFSKLFNKSLIINGFRNHAIRNLETEILPNNFEDIESIIELRKLKKDIMENKYLLSEQNHYNMNKVKNIKKNRTSIKLNEIEKDNKKKVKNNKMTLIKNIKGSNDKIAKIIILKKIKDNKYNLFLENNKTERPITSKNKRKVSIGIIKDKKNDINNKRRIIKSAKGKRTQIEREYNFQERNIKNSFANNSNRNLSNCTTTFKSYSKSFSKPTKVSNNKLFKNIEKQILNHDNVLYNTPKEKNEFKSAKQLIRRIVNDCEIIDKYIRKKKEGMGDSSRNDDKENILLELDERLKQNKMKKLHLKVTEKPIRKIKKDEIIFKEKLEKIPDVAKKFFRDVYKQILFEKRVLNKIEKSNIIDAIEEQQNKKKFSAQFKKEAKEKMLITKANIITEKDDKKLLEEQRKKFDFYGNLDGLEWLITKRNIMSFGNRNDRNKV